MLHPERKNVTAASSAVVRRAAPKRPTPWLPLELWIEILQAACFVPRNLEPNFMPTGLANAVYAEQEREFLEVLATRRNVVLVCKTWYILATPILYERILLSSVGQLKFAKRAFYQKHGPSSTLNPDKPLWTCPRRLDVWITDTSTIGGSVILDMIAAILRKLSNLELLTFSRGDYKGMTKMPPRVFSACPPSLRYIVWHEPILPPDPIDFIAFLRTHPNIQAISNGTTVFDVPDVDLSKITTLYYYLSLPPIFYQFKDVQLKNLRHLVYDINNTPTYGPFGSVHRFEIPLLSVVGHQLSSITFVASKRPDLADSILEHTHLLSASSPNVTRFDIIYRSWSLVHLPFLPPKTHTMGIRVVAPDVKDEQIEGLLGKLKGFPWTEYKSLRRVQFTDPRDVKELRRWVAQEDNVGTFRATFERHNISVVDHDGYAL